MFLPTLTAVALALATTVLSQTTTTCDPLNATCPDDPALGTTFFTTFNASMQEFDPQLFTVEAGAELITFTDEGAELTIQQQGDSVTIHTAFYVFFGQIEVLFKAAAGQGIISTFNMLSDDLDEIDWEIMGGNTSYVSTNYYGWGNTSQFNSEYIPTMGANWGSEGAMGAVHNYTVAWTENQLEWLLDGQSVRTVPYKPAGQWPQTPSYLKFGIWAGGDPTLPEGTIKWAGGPTDYSKGPFTMTIQSMKIIDAHTNSSSYSFGNKSGTYESIDVVAGQSAAFKAMHELSTSQKIARSWSHLSTGAKIGIFCAIFGLLAIALVAFGWYCVAQRRRGKRERQLADEAWNAQQSELASYREQMKRGQFAVSHMGHGEKF